MNNANGRSGAHTAFNVDEAMGEESITRKRQLANNMNDNKDRVRSNFSTLYNIDKFTAGLNGMQKGMSEIAGEFEYLSNVDQSFVNESLYGDDSLATKADELYISHDFVGNNSMEINTYNKSILGKLDGTSVNEGDKSLTDAHVNEDTTISKENLGDIAKGPTVEQHAEEIDGINKEDSFASVTKDTDMTGIKIDDGTRLTAENLENIEKEGGDQEQHLEEHYEGVQEKQLGSIANGELGQHVDLEINANNIEKVDDLELEEQ